MAPGGPDDLSRFRAPVGTADVLPPESSRWTALVAAFAERAGRYGFDLVVTPIFEHLEVFQRVGESTDVVRKEMYDFEDKGGRRIALRPEGTAGVARAFAQHSPVVPWTVWYVAPHFRYERPQKGRFRQHFQVGAEVLGVDDPQLDVEVIALAHGFYRALGLREFTLSINSMGDEADRLAYVRVLRDYLLDRGAGLGETFRERVEANPIRVLDTKDPDWQDVVEHAPQIRGSLGDHAREHFEAVQRGLDRLGIAHEINPRLVRGLDYYTSTTFEFASQALDSAQDAIGGGGRYDKLVEQMGGKPTPGIGFGIGIERLLIACEAEGVAVAEPPTADVFVVDAMDDASEVTLLATELREDGMRTERAYGGRSFKAQMKVADRSGARFAVVLGRQEAEHAAVSVKDMQSGDQVEVPRELVAGWLQERLEADPRRELDSKR
ncbi:MAG TPA: histidine--tRNA ligase [Acidimicrobiia bacterium]|nr:histidine--tRNA ligase [Acidimicrobiia bacterium]